jgi:hypothetical protein
MVGLSGLGEVALGWLQACDREYEGDILVGVKLMALNHSSLLCLPR